MTPDSVGIPKTSLVLGKLSGRHAFRERVKDLGYRLSEADLELAFKQFKQLADKKRDIYDEDIESIVQSAGIPVKRAFDVHLRCLNGLFRSCRFDDLAPSAWADSSAKDGTGTADPHN